VGRTKFFSRVEHEVFDNVRGMECRTLNEHEMFIKKVVDEERSGKTVRA